MKTKIEVAIYNLNNRLRVTEIEIRILERVQYEQKEILSNLEILKNTKEFK